MTDYWHYKHPDYEPFLQALFGTSDKIELICKTLYGPITTRENLEKLELTDILISTTLYRELRGVILTKLFGEKKSIETFVSLTISPLHMERDKAVRPIYISCGKNRSKVYGSFEQEVKEGPQTGK